MNTILHKIKINSIVDGLVCIAIGVVMIVWTGMSAALLTNVFGGLLLLAGVLLVMSYFARDDNPFFGYLIVATGIVIALFGVWVLTHNYQFQGLIPKLFGIVILVSGMMNLLQSLSLMGNKYKYGWLSFLLAVATIIIGIIFLTRAQWVSRMFLRVLGGCLIYNGLSDLWITSRVTKVLKKEELTIAQAIQDAQAIDVTDFVGATQDATKSASEKEPEGEARE